MSLYNDIQGFYARRKVNVKVGTIDTQIRKWGQWYKGKADYHTYQVRTATGNKVDCERMSMNLPKKMCEDYSSLLWNEKSNLTLENDELNNTLQDVLKKNNFQECIVDFLEVVEALGGGATIQYVYGNEVKLDFIDARKVLITDYHNKKVNGLITISISEETRAKNENTYDVDTVYIIHLSRHLYKDGVYRLTHDIFESNDQTKLGSSADLSTVFEADELSEMTEFDDGSIGVEYETDFPPFQYWKVAKVNNWDLDSSYGISRFENCLDDVKVCDSIFDSKSNEIDNTRSRIVVDLTHLKEITKDMGQDSIAYFDKEQSIFIGVKNLGGNYGSDGSSAPIVFTPQERTAAIDATLVKAINQASWKFGLGKNHYEVNQSTGHATATEVIHTNDEKWRHVTHSQNVHENNFKQMSLALLEINASLNKETLIKLKYDDLNVNYDDSIIVDDEKEYQKDFQLMKDGLLSMTTFLVKWLGYTEDQAKKEIEKAAKEQVQIDIIKFDDDPLNNNNNNNNNNGGESDDDDN